jgi:1-deoxy-D-xylulose-5-phosphate reductoisomerase
MMKKIIILGSTGSIGKNCLEIVQSNSERFQVVGLSAKDNFQLLAEQAVKFQPSAVAISNPSHYFDLRKLLPSNIQIHSGEVGTLALLETGERVNAMVGAAGLLPTIKALEKGKTVALANKESLVAGGELVLKAAKEHNAQLLPIDSEHSAIFQCLIGEDWRTIDKLVLTASGGPFLDKPLSEFSQITPEMALKHPNWAMGPRITVDSATMVNKGLEVIEAHWLFHIPPERIEVVIHRQSIVHSLVHFTDGAYIAQMGAPDMKLPIQFAMTYPERISSPYGKLDWSKSFRLDFQPVPKEKFPALKLAYRALELGGVAPAVLNAADETAVALFLAGKISFDRIPNIIENALSSFKQILKPAIEDILSVDKETRERLNSKL